MVILIAAIGVAVGVRLSRSHPAAASSTPVCDAHLAVLGALSGSSASLGISIRQGAQVAVDRYNQQHSGCAVTLVGLDSGGDSTKAATLAAQAVADPHMMGLIGPVFSSEATSVLPVLDRAGLTAITPSASDAGLSTTGGHVFHRAIVSDTAQATATAAYIRDTMAAKRVFIVDDDSSYGARTSDAVQSALAGLVVGTDRVTRGQSLAGAVADLKRSGADVVYYGGFYYGAGPLLSAMRKAGVTTPLIGGEGIDDPAFFTQAAGGDVDGTLASCAACRPISDAGFLGAFHAAFHAEPTGYAAVAYDTANIFLSGLAHGAGTRPAMLAYVNAYNAAGMAGRYRFDRSGTGELAAGYGTVGIVRADAGTFTWVTGLASTN